MVSRTAIAPIISPIAPIASQSIFSAPEVV
jgi:hypothetical protein